MNFIKFYSTKVTLLCGGYVHNDHYNNGEVNARTFYGGRRMRKVGEWFQYGVSGQRWLVLMRWREEGKDIMEAGVGKMDYV